MFDEQPDGDLHGECAAEIHRLEIALKIKTEEHGCCAEDLATKHGGISAVRVDANVRGSNGHDSTE